MVEKWSTAYGHIANIFTGGRNRADVNRRDVLASAGVAVGTSGCLGLLDTPCEPGEDELGPVQDELEPDRNVDVSIRGVVVKFEDTFMVISDGTGLAEVAPPGWKRFNEDWFERGDCVKVTGVVLSSTSRDSGRVQVNTGFEEDIETVGEAERDPPKIPSEPDASFAIDFDPASDAATVTHTGGEPIPARRLEIRRLHGEEVTTYPWPDLTDEQPDDEVTVGDSLAFEKSGDSHLMWRYNDHWSKKMSSGWSL